MKNNIRHPIRHMPFASLIFALITNIGCQSSSNKNTSESPSLPASTSIEEVEKKTMPEDKIPLPSSPTDSKSAIEVLFHEIFRLSHLQNQDIEDFLEQSYSKNTTLRLQWVHSNKNLNLKDIYPDHVVQNFGWCDLNSQTTLVPCAVIFDITKFSRKGLPDRFLFRVLDRRSDNGPSLLYSSDQVEGQQIVSTGKYFTNLDTKNEPISYNDLWKKIENFKRIRDFKKLPHPMGRIEINPILVRESEINSYLVVKNLCPSSKMNERLPDFETAVQGNYGLDVNYHSAISDLGSHPDFLEVDIRNGNYVNLIAVKFPDNYVMSVAKKQYQNVMFIGYSLTEERLLFYRESSLDSESFFKTDKYRASDKISSLADICLYVLNKPNQHTFNDKQFIEQTNKVYEDSKTKTKRYDPYQLFIYERFLPIQKSEAKFKEEVQQTTDSFDKYSNHFRINWNSKLFEFESK